MLKKNSVDKYLLGIIITLVVFGLLIFLSASLGLLAKEGARYSSVVMNQLVLGLFFGGIVCYITSKIPYKFWGKYSFWLFLAALILTAAVFIPGIGAEAAGAKRWIYIGPISMQPAEFLKIAYVIYLATWLSSVKSKVQTFQMGTLPFLIISLVAISILALQPDNDTILVMMIAGCLMYFMAGANFKHILIVVILIAVAGGSIIATRPYVRDRIMTFVDPSADPLASGYQIQQALIAIGSGGLSGRGFGQSVQKFNFLPEPISDSIFAVAAEEFGFIGASFLILLFIALLIKGFKIAVSSKESFGGLLVLGLVILIAGQSFVNIASMLGIFPLSGLPLLFVSHGGSALFFTLFASGIILNVSRFQKK